MDHIQRQKVVCRAVHELTVAAHNATNDGEKDIYVAIAARYAWALWHDFKDSRHRIAVGSHIQQLQEFEPDNPEHFRSLDAIDDFLHHIDPSMRIE